MINNLMQSNGDPNVILNQLMGNATPSERQPLLNTAKNYGVPNDILSRFQNMN